MEEKEKQASVSFFVYEGSMARMERVLRLVCLVFLVALIAVSSALVINDNGWRKYCKDMEERHITEVQNAGVYQQPDQGTDQ